MLNKQVILLILISFIDTDVSARGSWVWEEAGVPMYPSGRPPYPITCNHCRSRGSNSGRSGHYATWTPCCLFVITYLVYTPKYIIRTCRDRVLSFTLLRSFLSSKKRVTGMHLTSPCILRITRNGIPFDISENIYAQTSLFH